MPLFKKKKSKKQKQAEAALNHANGSTAQQATHHHDDDAQLAPPRRFKFAPLLSKTSVNVGGLPVSVYGLAELTPASSRASAAPVPDLCIAIHMHGRGGAADNEEKIMRQVWDRVQRSKTDYLGTPPQRARHEHDDAVQPTREFLVVGFDARNHGHRMTHELGQKGWKQDNKQHAVDLYAMVVGTARDVSFLVDFLPAYLFPHDERRVTRWAVTGKSLGGHATWHALAEDPRISIGVPWISCPSYAALMAQRAPKSFVANAPPYVPGSLSSLVAQIDPASRAYDVPDPHRNPFYGKKICMCNGQEDRLVPWSCAQEFVSRLCVGPQQGRRQTGDGILRVVLEPGVGHEVTENMIEEGGHWIFMHGVLL